MDNCYIAHNTQFVPLLVCAVFFILGLPIVAFRGGILIFTVFQDRSTNSLMIICVLELIVLFWISTYRFLKIEKMEFNDSWFTEVLKKMGMGLAGNGNYWQFGVLNYIINGLKKGLR